jgi:hypothetical protein
MWTAAILLLAAGSARAQVEQYPGTAGSIIPIGEAGWTATAGRTVGSGNSVIQAEAGWPGISFTYLHGANERTDWGARVNFNYKFMNTDNNLTGVDLQVPYRFRMTDDPNATLNVALQASPGLTLYSNNGSTLFGVGGPLGVVVGGRVSDTVTLDAGVDIPVLLSITNPFGVVFGPLVGVGGEYMVDRNLAVTARIRVGPEVSLDHTGSNSQVGVQTLIGVAYNMR